MNPDRIYSNQRDDAIAQKIGASEYTTFVAMPFTDSFSYRYKRVLEEIIQAAAKRATELGLAKRPFATPRIVSDGTQGAIVISDTIVENILYSHLFVGDMTLNNPGAILEVGIAMGLKPNKQIILITQGKYEELHFDIRNNNVFSYNGADAVDELAQRFGTAALSFEDDADRQIRFIQQRVSPDASALLNAYGRLQRQDPKNSLFVGIAPHVLQGERAAERFDAAARELLENRLLKTDWQTKAADGADAFGMHATPLGWVFIGQIWPEIAKRTAPAK
jgi:hypothetical protein